jgi:UDP-GlcNAc:undecaprenyl-phosphate GlcNAc-1-phosphate transferase
MDLNLITDFLIISIIASMAINSALRNLAKKRKVLVDIPDRSRKFHKRATPLTGGLAILIASVISGQLYLDFNGLKGYVPDFTYHLIIASIILVTIILDRRFQKYKAINPNYVSNFFKPLYGLNDRY